MQVQQRAWLATINVPHALMGPTARRAPLAMGSHLQAGSMSVSRANPPIVCSARSMRGSVPAALPITEWMGPYASYATITPIAWPALVTTWSAPTAGMGSE